MFFEDYNRKKCLIYGRLSEIVFVTTFIDLFPAFCHLHLKNGIVRSGGAVVISIFCIIGRTGVVFLLPE